MSFNETNAFLFIALRNFYEYSISTWSMFQQRGKKLCYMLQRKDDSELFFQVKLGVEEHYPMCCCWFHVHVCSFIGIIIIIIISLAYIDKEQCAADLVTKYWYKYFCKFIGKFHFWNVFLLHRNSKNCGEAIGRAQKIWPDLVSALKLFATIIWCEYLAGQNNDNLLRKIALRSWKINKTSSFYHISSFTGSIFFGKICDNCGCSCDICGWSDCDNCGCSRDICGWSDCNNCGCNCDNCDFLATILIGVATIVVDCNNCEHCDNCDHITYRLISPCCYITKNATTR